MSVNDPDLRAREENVPVAIDVVDGKLIVKRHSGREESFFFGYNDGQRLEISLKLDALAQNGSGDLLALYQQALLEANGDNSSPDNPTADGIAYGDDFVMTSVEGTDTLWFRKPGLYVGHVQASSTSDGDWLVHYNFVSSVFGVYDWVLQNSIYGAPGTISFDVGDVDLVRNVDGDLWAPGDAVRSGGHTVVDAIQKGSGAASVDTTLSISRVS